MRIHYNSPRIDANAQFDSALKFMRLGERIIFHAHLEGQPCENISPYPVTHECWDSININVEGSGYDQKRP